MFMLVLHILCHNLVGYESSRGLGTKIAECGYETSKPGYESSGYEKSMGTKRLVTIGLTPPGFGISTIFFTGLCVLQKGNKNRIHMISCCIVFCRVT